MANRQKKIQANEMRQKQREFNDFKNNCLNNLIRKNVAFYFRQGADKAQYEYVLINGNVKGYFIYKEGKVSFEEMVYPEAPVLPEVTADVVSDQG